MREAEWAMLEVQAIVSWAGITRAMHMHGLDAVHRADFISGRKISFSGSRQRVGNRWRERRHQDSQANYPGGKAPLVSIEPHAGMRIRLNCR